MKEMALFKPDHIAGAMSMTTDLALLRTEALPLDGVSCAEVAEVSPPASVVKKAYL